MQPGPLGQIRHTALGMRMMLILASILIFTIGIPLFVLTEQTETLFAWTIQSSLTAAFLGAVYWSSGILAILGGGEPIWANARVSVVAVLILTVLTLATTLLYLDSFHFNSPDVITQWVTWAWLGICAAVPVLMGLLLLFQNSRPGGDPPRRDPIPDLVQALLVGHALVLIPLGIALLAVPDQAAVFWPWSLTPLTARAIGAWVVATGIAAAHAYWERDRRRVRPFARSYLVLGLLQAVALARYPGEVDWGDVRLWVYLYILVTIVGIGLYGWVGNREAPNAQPAPA